jgi:hypothetical protein
MNDAQTQKPLRVRTDEIAAPYLRVPFSQLDQLRERLNRHAIRYWVDSQVISVDGGPEIAYVNFDRRNDPARIQAILDEAE